jgi:NADH:ubiquinone oxidoreductase subunit F (NADH-binding)
MASPPSNKFRTYVLTASVVAITAAGAWYGAGLKTRQEYQQVRLLFFVSCNQDARTNAF